MPEFDFQALLKFLKHADNDKLSLSEYLSTNGFPDSYKGLSVRLGFGKGVKARVPWVAFVGFEQTVTNGIYPVFLYYREQSILSLAYGLSSWNKADTQWNFPDTPMTIKEYFKQNNLKNLKNYQKSYVFKAYNVTPEDEKYSLDENEVMSDLTEITNFFKKQFEGNVMQSNLEPKTLVTDFIASSTKANFRISETLATRFIASLLTKPFVILTGLSGSGKTKLAQIFAQWICSEPSQYRLVPVGADWTNREPLLGYPNALRQDDYVHPDNGVLDLIIEAGENPNKPYFLILDEMNMSHVERYFADFLSAMESHEAIFLHSQNVKEIPRYVELPENLFIVGTVNVDETTYMFSPKVLDRANVLEFRVEADDMENFLQNTTRSKISMDKGGGSKYSTTFMELRNGGMESQTFAREKLMLFFKELKRINAEFGYRTAAEINLFCAMMKKIDPEANEDSILDHAILQKLLPKVHGSRQKLDSVLKKIMGLCLWESNPEVKGTLVDELASGKIEFNDLEVKKTYPLSLEKLLRMYRSMHDNGFTSFTEA